MTRPVTQMMKKILNRLKICIAKLTIELLIYKDSCLSSQGSRLTCQAILQSVQLNLGILLRTESRLLAKVPRRDRNRNQFMRKT